MTPAQADQAASVMSVLRPDWTKVRIASVLVDKKVQAQDGRVALIAVVLCATDPRSTAPGFLLTDTAIWAAARLAVDPTTSPRPQPPRLVEMCVCGRPQHRADLACPTPQPAGRVRPASTEQVHAVVETTRRLLAEKRARAKEAEHPA